MADSEVIDLDTGSVPDTGDDFHVVQNGESVRMPFGVAWQGTILARASDTGYFMSDTGLGITDTGRFLASGDTGLFLSDSGVFLADTGQFLSDTGKIIADSGITQLGRNLIDDTGQTTMRATLGLGSSAVQDTGYFMSDTGLGVTDTGRFLAFGDTGIFLSDSGVFLSDTGQFLSDTGSYMPNTFTRSELSAALSDINIDGVAGDWWGNIPFIKTGGAMEVGKFLDFHDSDTGTADNDGRLSVEDGVMSFDGKRLVDTGNPMTLDEKTLTNPIYNLADAADTGYFLSDSGYYRQDTGKLLSDSGPIALTYADTGSAQTFTDKTIALASNTITGLESTDSPTFANLSLTSQLAATASSTFYVPVNLTSTDASASGGPYIQFNRTSASPAANDIGGTFIWRFNNSTPAVFNGVAMQAKLIDETASSENVSLRLTTSVNGANNSFCAEFAGGVILGSPTGGDKGVGTLNATAVYDDNTLLTCYVFDQFLDGSVDSTKWDEKVPDREIQFPEPIPKQKTVRVQKPVEKVEMVNGKAVLKITTEEVEELLFNEVPVEDEKGKPVLNPKTKEQLIHREPVLEKVVQKPNEIETRTHKDMRKFVSRIGTDYDPFDLDKYWQHIVDKRHLTSMPNEDTFDPEKGMASGEWIQRLVETVEIQAIHIHKLNERLKKVESKVSIIENKQVTRT